MVDLLILVRILQFKLDHMKHEGDYIKLLSNFVISVGFCELWDDCGVYL